MKKQAKLSLNYHQISSNTHLISSAEVGACCSYQGVQHNRVFGQFLGFCKIEFVCTDVAMCDLVDELKTVFYLCYLLTGSVNFF